MKIYIESKSQISIQEPLSDQWFEMPIVYDRLYVRSINPIFKNHMSSVVSRRMGVLLKRAIVTSKEAIEHSGVLMPDAIITGTGLGCIENTEIFLNAMIENGEGLLQPTYFMQSTHNTIGSVVSIELKCHGYNSTYVQKSMSFDIALFDAFLQFELGQIETALVGGHDEMTESYYLLLSRIGYWRSCKETNIREKGEVFSGETSVSFVLSKQKTSHSICCISLVEIMYNTSDEELDNKIDFIIGNNAVDAVMMGISGNKANDEIYERLYNRKLYTTPVLMYKPLFGESYTASGLGLYVAATCVDKGYAPSFLTKDNVSVETSTILLINQSEGKNYSLIILQRC